MNQVPCEGPLVLLILDGWGCRDEEKHNAIKQAHPEFFNSLWQDYPHTKIDGSGPAVGLPQGIMGNSEVGHMNLGAGRVVFTGLSQIYNAIESGEFFKNEAFQQAIHHVKKESGTLHVMGLLSDGAVHSHQDHLHALLELAKKNDVFKVAIHCFMDGRDTSPQDGIKYLEQLENKIAEIGVGFVASLSGRYYAMDRDKRWERVEKAFLAITGKSKNQTSDARAYLKRSYAEGIGDEFVIPVTVTDKMDKHFSISKNDAMIFYNFRADRARQISHAFTDETFQEFKRDEANKPGVFVCMAPYEKNIDALVAFTPNYPTKTFPEILSQNGLKQLRIAETEKYAHVTFFFNGGVDQVFEGEERVLIASPKEVPTYDHKPEMSAYQVKDELIKRLKSKKYKVIICNFANTDMVGHTAKKEAIIKAVKTVDQCLSEIVPEVLSQNGTVIVTADHGNAEEYQTETGEPMTAHTTNLVPFILINNHLKSESNAQTFSLKSGGRLCDVAPTMLDILCLEKPKEMTGKSLLK